MSVPQIDKEIAAIDKKLEKTNAELAITAKTTQGPVWWSTTNAMTMSASVLVFGLTVICIAAWLIKRGKTSGSILRVFGTILILVMAVFLVVAGYSDQQIAPVLGLLGTIAGYLLGRETTQTQTETQPKTLTTTTTTAATTTPPGPKQ